MSYTYLKLQDKTLMAFDRENAEYKVYENDLLPFVLRDTVKDTTNLPDAEKYKVAIKNSEQLTKFFTERSLSINRENAKFILNELGISQKSDSETKEKMMIMCKALSAADDYWITENKEESWSDINVRENPLHETLAQIALFGKSLSVTGKIRTPELTGLGAYAKAWFRDNGTLYLYKAGTKGGNEAEREALTSRILDCFNVPQIEYELTQKEDKVVTKCKQMNNSMYSIADAGDVSSWCMKNDKECNPIGFSLITGVDYTTVVKWATGAALSSEGFNLSQKLRAFREESLSSKLPTAGRNAVGILAILNHHFSWNLPGVSKEITAAPKTVADLPTLDGQIPKIEAVPQDIVVEQLPNTT